jgi:PRTRC genetic system protein E
MIFTELLPLLAERDLVITLTGKPEGKVLAYVQPKPKTGEPEAEAGAFLSPFVVTATAQELDAQLPAALAQWVAVRQGECASVQAALDAAKAHVKASGESGAAKSEGQDCAARQARQTHPPGGEHCDDHAVRDGRRRGRSHRRSGWRTRGQRGRTGYPCPNAEARWRIGCHADHHRFAI